MSITGADLYNKIRKIMPGLSSGITPEVLKKTCDDPAAQSFLKWFCTSVGWDNVLSADDVCLEKHIKNKEEWLEGEELDRALADATKDCPELMKLLDLDSSVCTRLSNELEAEKNAYKEDTDYVETLEESIKNLKKLGMKLDDDIESEKSQLEKDNIKVCKVYMNCIATLEEFDLGHHQFFRDIETLLQVYADAIEKKGRTVVWTQVPLDNFVKQMELHNDYLGIYVKRHFGGKVEQDNDSDYGTLIDDGRERCGDEKVHELLNCQTDIITSKTDEINAIVKESADAAMAVHAFEIYNSSDSVRPQSETQLRAEIASLTRKRDFLEENIGLIRDKQLEEVVRQYARLAITKILVDDGQARADRTKIRLEKLEYLRTLARENGHGHSDLLCMLMQLQLRRLKEIVEFIADGRHYLATEYSLSSLRTDSMREQQAKYDAILKTPPTQQNIFSKILIALLFGKENNPTDLNIATRRYDELEQDNARRKKDLLGIQIDTRIDKLKELQDEIMPIYEYETKGPTKSFKPMSYELSTRLEESTKRVSDMQDVVKQIRAKIKKMSRKTSENSFERDTAIMWQRFLTDPDELQAKYDEAKKKIESSHFSVTSNM